MQESPGSSDVMPHKSRVSKTLCHSGNPLAIRVFCRFALQYEWPIDVEIYTHPVGFDAVAPIPPKEIEPKPILSWVD